MGFFGSLFSKVVPRLIGSIGRRVAPKIIGNLATRGVQTLAEKTGVGNLVGQEAVADASKAVGGLAGEKAESYFQK